MREDVRMADTTARMLALLALLQARPEWPGPELADRFGVSVRTIRNDMTRLRDLGYPVSATRGSTGAYRLGAGAALPPLLLDDEEAVAVAVGLRSIAGLAGVDESSARALAKLRQVLPARLRRRVAALGAAVDRGAENIGTDAEDPVVDADALAQVAEAIDATEWLRFRYRDASLVVEPYRLVTWQRRWYVVGRDPASGSWAPYRLDWMELRPPTRRSFAPHPLEETEYTDFVLREVASTGWAVHARITVLAEADAVLARINPTVGVVEPLGAGRCVLVTGADSVDTIAAYIGMLEMDFLVEDPPELVAALERFGRRYLQAVGAS